MSERIPSDQDVDEEISEWFTEKLMLGRLDAMRRSYEMKVDDLRRETLRCSALQRDLDNERQANRELWDRYETVRGILAWLRDNFPQALELCPYKFREAGRGD